jgi:hypothetical protein
MSPFDLRNLAHKLKCTWLWVCKFLLYLDITLVTPDSNRVENTRKANSLTYTCNLFCVRGYFEVVLCHQLKLNAVDSKHSCGTLEQKFFALNANKFFFRDETACPFTSVSRKDAALWLFRALFSVGDLHRRAIRTSTQYGVWSVC